MTTLQEVLTEWQSNLAFRQQFKKNPEQALLSAGFTLSPEDLAKIKVLLDKSKNDKLDDRINK